MKLAAGTRLGSYEIIAPLGEGGMGEVYRAKDTNLDRDVAVKVLPERLLNSPDIRSRFEKEAKAVAALSHPNILAIHDFGEQDGTAYAVTELLEGATLAERLVDGPLPVRKALEFAGQMAEGLAAAHEKGIVHRDLKPANVFLTGDGRLKILDFGLAKTTVADDGRTQAQTLGEGTDPGTVLGTVGYMSPEQVRAEPVDSRSDIFSFGTVLHEMLTANRPFARDSAVETMSAILREDAPDSSSFNPAIPPSVDRIIHRCMEKTPETRFQSARDLAFALGNSGDSSSRSLPSLAADTPVVKGSPWRTWMVGLALLVLGSVVGVLIAPKLRPVTTPEPVRILPLTHTGKDWSPSASPDGRMIAFLSTRDGTQRVWLRQMQSGSEVPLTEGNDAQPSISPDGSSVLFLHEVASGRYDAYRIPVVGGQPRRILGNVAEVDWAPDGNRVAFTRAYEEAAVAGSIVGTADVQSGKETELARFPGRLVLGLAWSPNGAWLSGISTGSVLNAGGEHVLQIDAETGETRTIRSSNVRLSAAGWHPGSDHLILAKSTSALGDMSSPLGRVVQLDAGTGHETTVFWVQSVYGGGNDYVRFDYLNEQDVVFDEILWRGTLTEVPIDSESPGTGGQRLTSGNGRDRQPAYSPDGSQVIFSSNRSGNLDLWALNVQTGVVRQLTDDDADDWDPAFTADGQGILWSSNRGGHLEIWSAHADGSGARQVTQDGVDAENPTQTADGQWITYVSGNPEKSGIHRIRTDGSDDTLIEAGSYLLPDVSPTGAYVAYSINDINITRIKVRDLSTNEQVFETDVPFMGYQNVISGGRVRWMSDESALVFVGGDETGRAGLYIQDFRPGEETRPSRRLLVARTDDEDVESFGVSPDGTKVTVARIERFRTVKLAQGLPRP